MLIGSVPMAVTRIQASSARTRPPEAQAVVGAIEHQYRGNQHTDDDIVSAARTMAMAILGVLDGA